MHWREKVARGLPRRSYKLRYQPLLAALKASTSVLFKTEDIGKLSGVDPERARQISSRLVREGLLRRVARGVFTKPEVQPEQLSAAAVFEHLVGGYREGEHFTGEVAMRAHGHRFAGPVTEMLFRSRVANRPRTLRPGLTMSVVLGAFDVPRNIVTIETKELGTLWVPDVLHVALDGLTAPHQHGGILEVVRFIAAREASFTRDALHSVLRQRPTRVLHRLGYLLEALGHTAPDFLVPKRVLEPRYRPLDPEGETFGALDKRWHLRVNVEPSKLQAALGRP